MEGTIETIVLLLAVAGVSTRMVAWEARRSLEEDGGCGADPIRFERKVRAPQSKMVDNVDRSQDQGIVQQKANRSLPCSEQG